MDNSIQTRLSEPFEDSDIEWRLQYTNEERGTGVAVPYVTNRAIQYRLDKTVGISNWKNEFIPWHSDGKKAAQLCGISIYFAERNEWVAKYDGAENSDIEPVKGGLSDSMKRAAVHWGIGRYLYEMDTVFVDIEKNGKTAVIKASSRAKLNEAHKRVVQKVFGALKPSAPDSASQVGSLAPQPASASKKPEAQTVKAASPEPVPAPTALPAVKNTYRVIEIVLQPSVRGVNTTLRLEGSDGEIVTAFMQGEDPAIIKGAVIENAVLTKKIKDGIVFYLLDSFDLALSGAA